MRDLVLHRCSAARRGLCLFALLWILALLGADGLQAQCLSTGTGTWGGGFNCGAGDGDTPGTGESVSIQSGHVITFDQNPSSLLAGITVVDGGTLATGNASRNLNTNTFVINGTFQVDQGGDAQNAFSFSYGVTGKLVFANTSGSFIVDNVDDFWPTSSGPPVVVVSGSGGITFNTSANRTVSDTLRVHAAINNSSATLTVNGVLDLRSGSSFTTAPTYGGSSTLRYAGGGTYTAGNEWGSPQNVAVASGTTFASGAATRSASGNWTIDGSLQVDQGGLFDATGTFTYNAGSTLSFANTTGAFTVSGSHKMWPTTNGPPNVNVTGSGGVDMNSVTRTVSGTVQLAASLDNAANLTVSTLQLNSGGAVGSAGVAYGSGATLNYATGGAYNVSNEWTTTRTPPNVTISTATLSLADATGTLSVSGDLTIESGGTLNLSTDTGEDLNVGGDFSNQGTFNANSRGVAFNGAALQSINGVPPAAFGKRASVGTFPSLTVNNAAGVIAEADLTVDDLTLTSGSLYLASAVTLTTTDPSGLGSATTSREITGDAGWRMLAAPVTGLSISDVTDDTPIQGFGDGQDKNFYTAYDGTTWTAPADLSGTLTDGAGFILYFFDNTTAGSSTLPLTLDATGGQPSDVMLSLHSAGDKFNLIGNPYGYHIDVTKLVGTTAAVPKTLQVWDDTGATFQTVSDRLALWQGAFLENTSNATQLQFPNLGKTTTATTFYSKGRTDGQRKIQLVLTGHHPETGLTTRDEAAVVLFRRDAAEDWDLWDVSKLTPLLANFATLGLEGMYEGAPRLQAQRSLPYEPAGAVELPITLTLYEMAGDFEISWPVLEGLPDDWGVVLVDTEAGAEVDLRTADRYAFSVAGTVSTGKAAPAVVRPVAERLRHAAAGRFILRAGPDVAVTAGEPGATLPQTLVLAPGYPNPFNPVTTFQYALPQAGPVRLAVYDVLGRRVAVLAQGPQAAGWHTVRWVASGQAGGLYLLRLESPAGTRVQTVTLLK